MNSERLYKLSIKMIPCLMVLFLLSSLSMSADETETSGVKHSVTLKPGEVQDGILVFEDEEGNFKYWFDARVMMDAAFYFENKNPLQNGAQLRRGTFALKATLYKHWEAEVDFNFGLGSLGLRDFWIKYNIPGLHNMGAYIQVGHFKEPFSLESLTSSRMLTFLERHADRPFTDGRLKGVAATIYTEKFHTTVGIFGDEIDANRFERDSERYGLNGRVVYTPIQKSRQIVHLGVAASYRKPAADNNDRVRFRTRPETRVSSNTSLRFLNTGNIGNVENYVRLGFEAATVMGPLQVQAEYQDVTINRESGFPNPNIGGGYIAASYFLTGESRSYDISDGEFKAFDHPRNSWGALQIAARYSMHDFNDESAGIFGGKQNQITLGLNYYANRNIKFQINYSYVMNDEYADGAGSLVGNDKFSFIQMRMFARI